MSSLWVGKQLLQVEGVKVALGPVHESGNEREIDRWIGAASAVMTML